MSYRILKPPKLAQHTKPKIYNKMALPVLLYGCETWAIREKDKYRITSAEMKFTKTMAKYTWQDYITNGDILLVLKINPVVNKIKIYINKLVLYNMFGEWALG